MSVYLPDCLYVYLTIWLSAFLPVCLSLVCLSINLTIFLLSVGPVVRLSIHLPVCFYVWTFLYLFIHLSVHSPVYLCVLSSIQLPICVSFRLFNCLSVCPFVYLSVFVRIGLLSKRVRTTSPVCVCGGGGQSKRFLNYATTIRPLKDRL